MSQHMMRYKVKADQVGHVEQLLTELFTELEQVRPAGLTYAAFKLPDGVSFMHLVSHEKHESPSRLAQIQALGALHKGLHTSCEEEPVRTELSCVGLYQRA